MDLLDQADQAFKAWLAEQKKPYAECYTYSQKVGLNKTATLEIYPYNEEIICDEEIVWTFSLGTAQKPEINADRYQKGKIYASAGTAFTKEYFDLFKSMLQKLEPEA